MRDALPERRRGIALGTAVCVGLAFLLLLLPVSSRDWLEVALAAALGGALIALAAAYRRAPRAVALILPFGYLLAVAVLRDAAGGGTSGFAGLFLLPILFLALFAGRAELVAGLVAMALAGILPIVIAGAPAYPTTTWRGAVVQILVAAIAGFTIQWLVERQRRQRAQLVELGRMKDELLSLVSHELRTPLTSIIGYLEMVSEDQERLSGDQKRYLATVSRNVTRLAGLVEDLLFVARVDEGRIALNLTDVDVAALVAQAGESARPVAERREVGVVLEVQAVPAVRGDRGRLAQLLDNLVSNAVKFTPAGGTVTLRAFDGDGCVHVQVADSGVGIPADELPHVFERFFRATTARSAETPGTGLGLAISHSIAQAHEARLGVDSQVGVGTTFSLDLPVAFD